MPGRGSPGSYWTHGQDGRGHPSTEPLGLAPDSRTEGTIGGRSGCTAQRSENRILYRGLGSRESGEPESGGCHAHCLHQPHPSSSSLVHVYHRLCSLLLLKEPSEHPRATPTPAPLRFALLWASPSPTEWTTLSTAPSSWPELPNPDTPALKATTGWQESKDRAAPPSAGQAPMTHPRSLGKEGDCWPRVRL